MKHEKKPLTHEQQVIQQGRDAYTKGAPLTANPYIDGTGDAQFWELGWHELNRKQGRK